MLSSKVPHTFASLFKGQKFKLVCSLSDGPVDDQLITSITADSREVTADSLFVAIPGVVNDGHDFIEAAVAAGCRAIVCGPGKLNIEQARDLHATIIEVEDTGTETQIRAKVWEDGTAEPAGWQMEAADSGADRLTTGAIGVWSYVSGNKYWDDLSVELLVP